MIVLRRFSVGLMEIQRPSLTLWCSTLNSQTQPVISRDLLEITSVFICVLVVLIIFSSIAVIVRSTEVLELPTSYWWNPVLVALVVWGIYSVCTYYHQPRECHSMNIIVDANASFSCCNSLSSVQHALRILNTEATWISIGLGYGACQWYFQLFTHHSASHPASMYARSQLI